jgi:hypothetical protein
MQQALRSVWGEGVYLRGGPGAFGEGRKDIFPLNFSTGNFSSSFKELDWVADRP